MNGDRARRRRGGRAGQLRDHNIFIDTCYIGQSGMLHRLLYRYMYCTGRVYTNQLFFPYNAFVTVCSVIRVELVE